MNDYYQDNTYRKHMRFHPIRTTFRVIFAIIIIVILIFILAIVGIAIWIAVVATRAVSNALNRVGDSCTTTSDCSAGLVCKTNKCATP